ncbi:Glycosyl transferase family 2 [Chitinophaga terrae (ex Kim and Jung 2007)]|uniref:Glycosyl transferase family 2 n=1 Tax=Chitinophaga terrae (ex Kim and Jung 2007) TaxID=408074 RepID=A0A1H3ZH41_9BACT|nr:glycosyltransferase family 2 protein [Chitinophaga terrae (ex Kim and Jung 2007)]MDQ0109749.1 hypothetical protein [Chitinophaga terrae (ex Kim and Jung 2007)]SEA23073.1 Glycosyl transferase family 2 [Chitinophaga terrae (ex Kim and Jung 2007)]
MINSKETYNNRQVTKYIDFFHSPGCSRLHLRMARQQLAAYAEDGVWVNISALPPGATYDLVVLEYALGSSDDIQALLKQVRPLCHATTLLIAVEYNMVWSTVIRYWKRFSGRKEQTPSNWLSHGDVKNIVQLEGMEVFRHTRKTLLPFNIPILGPFMNRIIGNLPLVNHLCLNHFYFVRFQPGELRMAGQQVYSTSIIIPARNESGNIRNIVERIPSFGGTQEIIFIEGNSTDDTWEQMLAVQELYKGKRNIVAIQQTGKGKANAVQEAFRIASGDVLMILDADISVCPEDLPKFYEALIARRGDFINGCRLVYKMEENAMRGFNLVGNKVFSLLFSWLLHQPIKDTLCGTKVLLKKDYLALEKNRSYFGDFDPFGDFDLLFGAYKLGLKIVDLPVAYKARTYGETNISRWKHGWLLLKMWAFAIIKIKFKP